MTAQLSRLSGRVWIYPGDPDPAAVKPCVAVIADDAGSTVVDAGQSPAHAHLVQSAMAEAGLPAACRLVYTHHHWDHTWGACAWEVDEIVGHEAGAALLTTDAGRPWSDAYLRQEMAANRRLEPSFTARARAMNGWEGFAVRPPTHVFTDRLRLPGGIDVRHVGGRHAPDSTVVAVPDSGVLLLGDSIYPPPYHLREPGPAGEEIDLPPITSLVAEGFDWYVDSHSPPWRPPSS
jgi:glyoxylase-like metal-dependent hydrolase (beta-lactamase superfamily II)